MVLRHAPPGFLFIGPSSGFPFKCSRNKPGMHKPLKFGSALTHIYEDIKCPREFYRLPTYSQNTLLNST